jgi:hypothetical protein
VFFIVCSVDSLLVMCCLTILRNREGASLSPFMYPLCYASLVSSCSSYVRNLIEDIKNLKFNSLILSFGP